MDRRRPAGRRMPGRSTRGNQWRNDVTSSAKACEIVSQSHDQKDETHMLWRIAYEDKHDRIFVNCDAYPLLERWVTASFNDLPILVRYAKEQDPAATFEFAPNAERFRAKIMAR
ncbi:MAG: hypothetical protein JNL81_03735 [Hyphomonadaceae bacterium]|nr:hypothetical protein [Hyphomonadaceae bacterium]